MNAQAEEKKGNKVLSAFQQGSSFKEKKKRKSSSVGFVR